MTRPNVEESLCAAAFAILTDGLRHEHRAQRWAERILREGSKGRDTEFQRRMRTARVRAFANEAAGA